MRRKATLRSLARALARLARPRAPRRRPRSQRLVTHVHAAALEPRAVENLRDHQLPCAPGPPACDRSATALLRRRSVRSAMVSSESCRLASGVLNWWTPARGSFLLLRARAPRRAARARSPRCTPRAPAGRNAPSHDILPMAAGSARPRASRLTAADRSDAAAPSLTTTSGSSCCDVAARSGAASSSACAAATCFGVERAAHRILSLRCV